MEIKIKLIDGGNVPEYKTSGSSGADIFSNENVEIPVDGEVHYIHSGFAVEIPEGFEMQVRPRSGLSNKFKLIMPNSLGTIDSDYRGEVMIPFLNLGSEPYVITKGERIAQAVICPVMRVRFEEVENLSKTVRGTGGFGSTGK